MKAQERDDPVRLFRGKLRSPSAPQQPHRPTVTMHTPLKKSKQVIDGCYTLTKSTQIIEDCYIDEDKLIEVCKQRFGSGNYQLKFKLNKWYLEVPSPLDEYTLKQCEIML